MSPLNGKRKKAIGGIAIGVATVVLAIAAGCASTAGSIPEFHPASALPGSRQDSAAPTTITPVAPNAPVAGTTSPSMAHHVVYEVKGGRLANTITYITDGIIGIEQASGESLPWSKSFDIPASKLNLYQVEGRSGDSGSITCKVTVDGQITDTRTATGPHAVVLCASR